MRNVFGDKRFDSKRSGAVHRLVAGPDEVIDGLLAIMAVGASLVQVANPDAAALPRRIETEKVTRVL